jgi:hypothetical protein
VDGRCLHLTLASFLILSDSTGDRVGRRKVFQTGLVLFTLGTVLAALKAMAAAITGFRPAWSEARPASSKVASTAPGRRRTAGRPSAHEGAPASLARGCHTPARAASPGHVDGAVDLRGHVLEADEGLILRLSEAERAEASRTRGVGSQRLDAALM